MQLGDGPVHLTGNHQREHLATSNDRLIDL
jgi:hypothetical protein